MKVPLEIYFSPKLLIDSTVFKVTLGMDTIITIPIRANPLPTEDQVRNIYFLHYICRKTAVKSLVLFSLTFK